MKDLKAKVNKKKIKKQTSTVQSITKSRDGIWKSYFEKKKDNRLHEEITDDNWWEFI